MASLSTGEFPLLRRYVWVPWEGADLGRGGFDVWQLVHPAGRMRGPESASDVGTRYARREQLATVGNYRASKVRCYWHRVDTFSRSFRPERDRTLKVGRSVDRGPSTQVKM